MQRKRALPGNAGTPVEPFALHQARENFPVTLYSTPGCEPCNEARKLLNSVPALTVGSDAHKGFEEGAYHSLLDAAGYPKTGILPARNQLEPKPR